MRLDTKLFAFLLIAFSIAVLAFLNIFIINKRREESIFMDENKKTSMIEQEEGKTQIVLTGDIMLGRNVETKSKEMSDFTYPFRKVADTLRVADIVFANLENPIIDNCPKYDSGYKFCANPEMTQGLVFSGVDVVSLANNHTLNYGQEGLDETLDFLSGSGIIAVGVGKLERISIQDTEYGFLGFDFVSNIPTQSDYNLVKESDEKVDVLIIGVHWGEEYKALHNNFQRTWAEDLVENGADIIVGHHPHWVQDVEVINGVPVFYSLGNFIFDQMWSEETKKGALVHLTYSGNKLTDQKIVNIYMSSWAQPEFVLED